MGVMRLRARTTEGVGVAGDAIISFISTVNALLVEISAKPLLGPIGVSERVEIWPYAIRNSRFLKNLVISRSPEMVHRSDARTTI